MATKFTFPRYPKIGDRIEIVSISQEKLPINLVGDPEAKKSLTLIFPDQTYTSIDQLSVIKNCHYCFGNILINASAVFLS